MRHLYSYVQDFVAVFPDWQQAGALELLEITGSVQLVTALLLFLCFPRLMQKVDTAASQKVKILREMMLVDLTIRISFLLGC